MAKAQVNIESVENFRQTVAQQRETIGELNSNLISSASEMTDKIAEELEKANQVSGKCEQAKTTLSAKQEEANAQIEDLYSQLASTPETITETSTDEDGNTTSEEVPNPEYARLQGEIASVQARIDLLNGLQGRLDALMNNLQTQQDLLSVSGAEVLEIIDALSTKSTNFSNLSETAVEKLDKIRETLQDYLDTKITPVYMSAGTAFPHYSSNQGQVSGWTGGGSDSSNSRGSSGGIFSKIFGNKNNIEKSLRGVEHRPIKSAHADRTEEDIINSVSGGDMTEGSCSSLALAYAGNKAGYVVYDFRDGQSRSVFSSRDTIKQIATMDGVEAIIETGTNDGVCAERLMSQMVPGKEYYMATGRHAAVVRQKSDGGYQYLELQSEIPSDNGWHPLTQRALYERFGCDDGHRTEWSNYLIRIDSLTNNNDFLILLGYINTDKSAQVKGVSGHVR